MQPHRQAQDRTIAGPGNRCRLLERIGVDIGINKVVPLRRQQELVVLQQRNLFREADRRAGDCVKNDALLAGICFLYARGIPCRAKRTRKS
jgi:hypothetical protein